MDKFIGEISVKSGANLQPAELGRLWVQFLENTTKAAGEKNIEDCFVIDTNKVTYKGQNVPVDLKQLAGARH